ncbi:MAG TPA: adenylate/guanylate cyclase domain-containing protein, partial [Burkholderiales bacterium]|nr:adenylate/guanylate cyclase domain-containing protein [Burkholderiales bacterium]
RVGLIDQLDNIIYDARLRLTMPGKADPRIVILDIDEKSLGEVGRWPWSRNVMARLMDKLFDQYRVALVGFDVVWAERDTSSGMDVLDGLAQKELKDVPGFQGAYQQLRGKLDFDGQFAAAIKGRPVVLGYYFNSEENAVKVNAIPEPVLPKGTFAGRNIAFARWNGYTGNLPAYLKNAAAAGHFNPRVDDDGVSRRVPMILEYAGAYYEPLSLAMVRTHISLMTGKSPAVEPGYPPEQLLARKYSGMEWIKVGPYTIPVDEEAAALIPYRGRKSTFTYLSLADVLNDRVNPEALRGKIAIVGTTAPGLQDLRSTPVESVYPGVEIHANMIAGILNNAIKERPAYLLGAEVLLLFIGGVALSLLIPLLSALWATVAAAGGIALIAGFNFLMWSRADMVLPLAASIQMAALLYTMNMAYGYFVESRSKRQFTELFGQYVPPELVDRMAADPRKYSMEPKAVELTILFSDVRGFTSISETLKPEELREYINDYLTDMSGIIRSQYHGTLDKYIGDAIMAFWGAPVEDPQHARHGVLAALAMQKECEVLNAKFAARGWPTLKIGVGLNTGNVRVGDMGSQVRRAYTVMGDPVNVASRLEGRTKHYGVGILVGESTRNAVKDVVFREVDRIKVKGKHEAVAIYEPIGLEADVDARVHEELKLWGQTLRAYRARQWDQVDVNLVNLQRMYPGRGLYALYADRVAGFRRTPPAEGWDGVTAFDEK